MIVTILEVKQEFTKNGDEYRKVVGMTPDGKQTTKSVFNQLQDKWGLLEEHKTIEFVMEKRGQFWNVVDIKETTQASSEPTSRPEQRRYGKSPEELELSRLSYALSYAKDTYLPIVEAKGEITPQIINGILELAETYNRFLKEGAIHDFKKSSQAPTSAKGTKEVRLETSGPNITRENRIKLILALIKEAKWNMRPKGGTSPIWNFLNDPTINKKSISELSDDEQELLVARLKEALNPVESELEPEDI